MAPNIAVIGCGRWGQNHVRTLAELRCLAGVADEDEARRTSFAERYDVPAFTADEAIAAPEIDALVLAMPAHLHGPTARKAFAAGKDVLVEKPIALDHDDALLTRKTAEETGRLLMVGHVIRFHPVFRRMSDLIAEKRIGTLKHLIANRLGLGRFLGMDAIWDLAPHDLSLILHLAGDNPDTIRCKRRTVLSDEADIGDMSFTFANGVTADVHVSRVSPYRDRRFVAIGTEGMLVFDDLAPENEKLAFYDHRVWQNENGFDFTSASVEYMPYEAGLPLTNELLHFIDCLKTRQRPETGGDEAVETVRILSEVSPLG